MKNNFTFKLMWLLYIFSSNIKEQTQFSSTIFKFIKYPNKSYLIN